jgi:E3 ubiquitin-protein ligase HUWE1
MHPCPLGPVPRNVITQVMAREIFNPNLALFVAVPEGGTTFQPNPNSIVQSDTGVSHLEFFKFVGRLVGKALYDGQMLDAYFTRSFYKHMLGQPLTYEVREVHPMYYSATFTASRCCGCSTQCFTH